MSQVYGDIGGHDAVEAVVSDFYDRVFADESLVHYFEDTDRSSLFAHQVQFISAVAGGPVAYEGTDMRVAHEPLGVTSADFDAVADHLEAALRENDVSDEHVDAILDSVAELKPPIVTA